MFRINAAAFIWDYTVTVNSASDIESYPLPRIDDLLSSLAGARVFTKLDLAHAYLQLALDEESNKLVTVSTHKGLFRYNRLPFGVASAPAIFQRVIEGILSGIHHVYAYMDDVLVANDTEAEHLSTLEEVLARLEQYGVRLNKAKCKPVWNNWDITSQGMVLDLHRRSFRPLWMPLLLRTFLS